MVELANWGDISNVGQLPGRHESRCFAVLVEGQVRRKLKYVLRTPRHIHHEAGIFAKVNCGDILGLAEPEIGISVAQGISSYVVFGRNGLGVTLSIDVVVRVGWHDPIPELYLRQIQASDSHANVDAHSVVRFPSHAPIRWEVDVLTCIPTRVHASIFPELYAK